MKFSEMPYQRVNMEELESSFKSLIERAKNAGSGEELFAIHKEQYKLVADAVTNMELAMIRHDIDTTDAFYEKERDFYDEIMPLLENLTNQYGKVLFNSPYREYMESKIGKVTFKNIFFCDFYNYMNMSLKNVVYYDSQYNIQHTPSSINKQGD